MFESRVLDPLRIRNWGYVVLKAYVIAATIEISRYPV
jgi:hypothetical protein